ncbi:AAA family ATPase [Devosia sp.]|uniref:AAA family ATPase n=1 Tax=Devosia sp. TaxID=1871048 RepID=UPI001AC0A736|nr:AAA family ATPase [Devosia sp.]MBN9334229.1 hypothetical protein [Devosia sp.]
MEALTVPGVIIIGATNFPYRIDPALLRAGRIERHVHIALPDAVDRRQIIAHYTGGALSAEQLTELSELTPQYSGADLESLTRRASAIARRQERQVSFEDVVREVEKPLEGLSSSDLRRATIYASGRTLVAEILNVRIDNRPAYPTVVDLRDQLAVLVAGRLAEEMLLGHASVLGEDDLAQASALAEAIELRLGFGARGLLSGRVRGSESDVRCLAHIEAAADRSMRLLADNRDELERRCSLGVPLPKASQKPWDAMTVH